MNSLDKWVLASLAVAVIATGPNPSVAGDGPGRTGDEIKLSPSLGTDRPLEFMRVSNVKMSRNGRRVVALTNGMLWSKYHVWDGETGRRLLRVESNTPQHYMGSGDIDESGRRILTGGSFNLGLRYEVVKATRNLPGSLADVWDAGTGRLTRTLVMHDQRGGACAAISRDGARAACADAALNVKLWDAETGRELASVAGAMPPACQADIGAFSDNVTRFVTLVRREADDRTFIYLCDLSARTTRMIDPPPGEKSRYVLAAIGGDGREVAAYLGDALGRELAIFDFETGAVRARIREPVRNSISYMAFSSDGTTIAVGMEDGHLDVVARRNGARVELRVSDGRVRAVAFPDRDRVRIVAERRWISNATRSDGEWAGPMRIADYRVRFPSPSP